MLPKYRGAAPIQWAIARGETVTGVTTMRIDAGLDTGDILLQKEIPIAPDGYGGNSGAAIGGNRRRPYGGNSARTAGGNDSSAHRRIMPEPRWRPILKKEDGRIDFQRTAQEI